MKSTSGIPFSQVKIKPQSMGNAFAILSVFAGLILALLLFLFGPITLPIAFFVLLVLPWLIQHPFRLFIWLIVTWPLLSPFVRISLPAGIPDISYERVLVLLLMCIVILGVLILKGQPIKLTTLDVLVLVYVLAQLNSRLVMIWFIGGTVLSNLFGMLDDILIPLLLYWLVKELLVSRAHLKWLLCAFVIACLLICLTGLYEQVMGVRVFYTNLSYEWEYEWAGRVAGAMGNPAVYGAILGFGILASFSLLPHVKSKFSRIALLATIGLLLYGVFVSYTRSAWLSVTIVLFAAQFFLYDLWKKTLPIFILCLLLLALIWPTLPSSSFVVQRTLNMNNVTARYEGLDLGWPLFLERPFFGWGADTLNNIGRRYGTSTSHNIYLTYLVDGGAALFLSFSAFVGYLMLMAIRVFSMVERGSIESNALVAMVGNVLIFLISGFFLELRYFGYFNALFWICAGVIDHLGIRSVVRRSFS